MVRLGGVRKRRIRMEAVLGTKQPLAKFCSGRIQDPRLRPPFVNDALRATSGEDDDGFLHTCYVTFMVMHVNINT